MFFLTLCRHSRRTGNECTGFFIEFNSENHHWFYEKVYIFSFTNLDAFLSLLLSNLVVGQLAYSLYFTYKASRIRRFTVS